MSTEPMAFRAVSAFLTSLSKFATHAHLKGDTDLVEKSASTLEILVTNFKKCCLMLQLIGEVNFVRLQCNVLCPSE